MLSKKTAVMALMFVICFGVASAYAQATRTWISGVGDDANPCSRTAPCKTFAGAISKTAAGGEINALDPGGFGAVTITKAITLDGGGFLTGITAASTNGINVNVTATPGAVVILRNLQINGLNGTGSPGLSGINYLAGGTLIVEKCHLFGFSQNGINANLTASGNLVVNNTSISNTASSSGSPTPTGIRVSTTSGNVNASIDNVTVKGGTIGIDALDNSSVTVSNSTILDNTSYGVTAENGGAVNLINSVLVGNYVAVAAQTGSTVRLSGNEIFGNGTGLGCGGGTLISAGNNHKGGNLGGPASCTPTGTVTLF